VIAENKTRKHI